MPCRVTIVIVNYRKAKRVVECLEALRLQSIAPDCGIRIIDNSEDDHQAQILRSNVRGNEHLFVSPSNLGYTRAVNLGVASSEESGYVLLVSPDIITDDRYAVEKMVRQIDADSRIGILATLQHNDDGSRVEVARLYPSLVGQILRRFSPARYSEVQLQNQLYSSREIQTIFVDWVQSSFMMLRRADWRAVGGLDEQYFLFMSDIEICRRIHRLGKSVAVFSGVDVRADGIRASAGGVRSLVYNPALRHHLKDIVTYYMTRTPVRDCLYKCNSDQQRQGNMK